MRAALDAAKEYHERDEKQWREQQAEKAFAAATERIVTYLPENYP